MGTLNVQHCIAFAVTTKVGKDQTRQDKTTTTDLDETRQDNTLPYNIIYHKRDKATHAIQ